MPAEIQHMPAEDQYPPAEDQQMCAEDNDAISAAGMTVLFVLRLASPPKAFERCACVLAYDTRVSRRGVICGGGGRRGHCPPKTPLATPQEV